METKLHPSSKKVLELLLKDQMGYCNGLTTKWLAQQVWPDSIGWRRTSNCGTNGAMRGKGPTFAMVALLKRLQAKKLIYPYSQRRSYIMRWFLTEKARELLKSLPSDTLSK